MNLFVADGWMLDELAADRLRHQLARAPAGLAAIAASTGPLPPGSSYRVHAERCALRDLDDLRAVPSTGHAAVIAREGLSHREDDAGIHLEIEPEKVLADPGVHVHDPWGSTGDLVDASPEGRPPFPRRPLVILAQTRDDEDTADWARQLTNELLAHEVEARLLTRSRVDGYRLTAPCSPTRDSVTTLVPDLAIALDEEASRLLPGWLEGNRSACLIEYVPDVRLSSELVSWRLDDNRGRLRARIGDAIGAAELSSLISRLCAGPQPMPPPRDPSPGPRIRRRPRRSPPPVVLGIGTDAPTALHGLLEGMAASGADVTLAAGEPTDRELDRADLVVVTPPLAAGLAGRLALRTHAGRSTLALLRGPLPEGSTSWSAALTPSPRIAEGLRADGIPTLVSPSLLTTRRIEELDAARVEPEAVHPVIGWRSKSDADPAVQDAASTAIEDLRRKHPDLGLTVVHADDEPRPEELARWVLQMWTPPADGEALDDRIVAESGWLGVPVLMATSTDLPPERRPPADLLVARPTESPDWSVPIDALLGPATRARRSDDVRAQAEALAGPTASAAVANRVLGWALRAGRR